MTDGNFERSFQVNDRVLSLRDPRTRDDPTLPYHMRWVWDGRPFIHKKVLVRCYHGLGDTLQFCRYLPALRARVSHLALEVQTELLPLLSSVQGPHQVLAFRPERPTPESECDIEIMELAHALRQAPTASPYISVAARLKRKGPLRVGICWEVNSTWAPERSVPFELLAPILAYDGIAVVSLQPGQSTLPGLLDDCPSSIARTANRIAGLDLVISIDSMVAHLAGALGIPLWLLLKAEPDWRWHGGGLGSIWYEDVRKFQQRQAGDWATPVSALLAALTEVSRTGTLRQTSGL